MWVYLRTPSWIKAATVLSILAALFARGNPTRAILLPALVLCSCFETCDHQRSLIAFSLAQTVTSSTSSRLASVWTTVPMGTLPASSSRSACAATLIAPRATARAPTTATCVATREPSVTTESVCPSATATLTTTRPPTNAEVGEAHLHWRKRKKEEF